MRKEDYPNKRAAAKAAGLKFFYTNKLCKYGHDELRIVHNGTCVECRRIYHRTVLSKRPAYVEYQRKYQAAYRLTKTGKANLKEANINYRQRLKDAKDEQG